MLTMEDMMVAAPEDGAVVDPMSWFESPGPFELEIGCGKGGFLVSRAKADPSVRLLGIEWANKYFRYCADRLARWNLRNACVMRTDAKLFVIRSLPRACVSVLHLYHPDPWPKKRHHKRRLVQPDFADAASCAIEPGGKLLVQSDHEEYFQHIVEVLSKQPVFSPVDWDTVAPRVDETWAGTNFEIKYARVGKEIFRAAFERTME